MLKPVARVASPPQKPLMVFDGDCHFCTLWIRRWQHATGDRVDYLPSDDPRIASQFPEIPREQFDSAVQLILRDGSVHSAAEAVFQCLATNPREAWLLEVYESSPGVAHFSEWSYRLVARHRPFFSFLTRLFWGHNVGPFPNVLVRRGFLQSLALIYLIAFASLWVQIPGLVGSHGVVPAAGMMRLMHERADAAKLGVGRYHLVPTFCWISASDASLNWQCAIGTALAVVLFFGIAPAPCLFLLWLIYLSLSTVCGVFLGFQWDTLLLETGFLAVFLAPLQWLPRRLEQESPPSRIVFWLLRWLLFRLMFESGCVKLLSGDVSWRHFTALDFHYETQPLPTWIGWLVYHCPHWAQHAEVVVMFIIELGMPFLIFLPRRPRQVACIAFVFLQVCIFLTGNYGFFNLLAIVLCIPLLDDDVLRRCQPSSCYRWLKARIARGEGIPAIPDHAAREPLKRRKIHWPIQVPLALLGVVLIASFVQFATFFRFHISGPEPVLKLYDWIAPFRSFNTYGLFAVMTTNRPEIIVEGSDDGRNWKPYEFKYKPGDVQRRPKFVAPYQPRLDWQMWFAALDDFRRNPWFVNFCERLLEGTPQVLDLLAKNPFPEKPPRYIRAELYEYEFTSLAERRRTGAWWKRKRIGIYLPPITLRSDDNTQAGNAARGPKRRGSGA